MSERMISWFEIDYIKVSFDAKVQASFAGWTLLIWSCLLLIEKYALYCYMLSQITAVLLFAVLGENIIVK